MTPAIREEPAKSHNPALPIWGSTSTRPHGAGAVVYAAAANPANADSETRRYGRIRSVADVHVDRDAEAWDERIGTTVYLIFAGQRTELTPGTVLVREWDRRSQRVDGLVRAAVEGRLPRGIGVERLHDTPAEWSRQSEALGLNPQ